MKSIHVVAETIPEGWEQSVIQTYQHGDRFKTEYDQEERGDPKSRDVTAMIHITNPMKEPRIHRSFPSGLDTLEVYRNEVILGIHDHWIAPEEGKWEYTYHQRLFEYDVIQSTPPINPDGNFPSMGSLKMDRINQIEKCIAMLKECGYSRRCQAVTWQAWKDLGIHDPACLQRLWMRVEDVFPHEVQEEINKIKEFQAAASWDGANDVVEKYEKNIEELEKTPKIPMLNMNVHIRSNDTLKAAFMNIYAFSELQKVIADEIGVGVNSLIWVADSYHLYGSYAKEVDGFLKTVETRSFKDRVWNSSFALPFFVEGCETLLKEEDMPEDKKQLVRERKAYLESLL